MIFEKAKIYGVDGVGGSSPTLTRTDSAVGLTYERGTAEIKSDFDRCFPWSDMTEVVDDAGNVFIRVPKFYSKITKNSNGTYKYQISGMRHSGFSTLFIDGKGNEIDYVDIGKYEGSGSSSRVYSKSGQTVLVNITIDNFRTGCKANGSGYQQYDFLIDLIIKQLFLIEFATTNCQGIMTGFTNTSNTAALITGHTDPIKTPSGSYNTNHDLDSDAWTDTSCNTDGLHACKYRGIENPWGNTWTFCDGVSFDKEKVFICTDPTSYAGAKKVMPYSYMGNRPTSEGWAKSIDIFDKNPLLMFTSAVGGSQSTYYCDYHYYADAGVILLVGGAWDVGSKAGLWLWSGSPAVGAAWSSFGGRLCHKPL